MASEKIRRREMIVDNGRRLDCNYNNVKNTIQYDHVDDDGSEVWRC